MDNRLFFMGNIPQGRPSPTFGHGDRVQHISKPKVVGTVINDPKVGFFIQLDSGNKTNNFKYYRILGHGGIQSPAAMTKTSAPTLAGKMQMLKDVLNQTFPKKETSKVGDTYYPAPACECGAHSCGYTTHSPWCPLFNK